MDIREDLNGTVIKQDLDLQSRVSASAELIDAR
jgi:hypothetical protein